MQEKRNMFLSYEKNHLSLYTISKQNKIRKTDVCMKKKCFISVIVLMFFSCTSKSSIINGLIYEDSIREITNEHFYNDSMPKSTQTTLKDSLIDVIYEQFRKNNVTIKYYEVSKNTKNFVPLGFVKVPDSIAYEKVFYKNGEICSEGYLTFFDSREDDSASEIGEWKYYTPDGTRFEKYYEYSIGIQKDSI